MVVSISAGDGSPSASNAVKTSRKRSHAEDAGGELFGALVGVLDQIDVSVGQRLQSG